MSLRDESMKQQVKGAEQRVKDAEERGQAEAIARNLREMSRLPVPVVVVCIGEEPPGVREAPAVEVVLDDVDVVEMKRVAEDVRVGRENNEKAAAGGRIERPRQAGPPAARRLGQRALLRQGQCSRAAIDARSRSRWPLGPCADGRGARAGARRPWCHG